MAEIPLTRASLLVRLRDAQDTAAWTEFVDLYAPLVYGFLRKRGLQDADAADLSQDVLRIIAGAVGRFDYDRQRGAFRNWLFTIVRRKFRQWLAREANGTPGSGNSAVHEQLAQCPAPRDDEATWETEWQQQVFAWACTQVRPSVTDRTWQAFWRTAVDGEGTAQVAADLAMSPAAVYIARSRVLARLRALVQSVQEENE